MKFREQILAYLLLLFAIGCNLWLYAVEPTAKIDPNDNPFQYALVHRTHNMWGYALEECPKNILFPVCFAGYLIDHWVPNWAQGFSLPYYYSHIPQIAIVSSFKLIHLISPLSSSLSTLTLFQWYHLVIYLLLCFFPVSVFFALRTIKLSPVIAGIGAIMATHISTDGYYGLDPSSFLWRGYGLTSQLFAMIWFPLAVAFAYRFFQEDLVIPFAGRPKEKPFTILTTIINRKTSFLRALFFLFLTVSGHLGIGLMTFLSLGVLAMSTPFIHFMEKDSSQDIWKSIHTMFFRLFLLCATALFFLSYWLVPAFLNNKYHNISFWDPVWKFNSWGWKEVMKLFLNGDLFDFGRFPTMTILILIGGFYAFSLWYKKREIERTTLYPLFPFSLLFLFWLLMFFGRATWGGIIDVIPGMKEFHQSRFIVGLHLAGIFLAPIGVMWFISAMKETVKRIPIIIHVLTNSATQPDGNQHSTDGSNSTIPEWIYGCVAAILLALALYPQTQRYANHNDFLIKRGNENFDQQNPDVAALITQLQNITPPGRVFTGRGGAWGKQLQIAETTYFMHLSTYGVPVILWLPETWSPNPDVEQFFIEEKKDHYDLLNIRYVVTPPDLSPQPFWKLVSQTPSWKLYSVDTQGYFTAGSHAAIIGTNKLNYLNITRLWLQSEYSEKRIFPELTFDTQRVVDAYPLPGFTMLDEATYQTRDGKTYGLFADIPVYEAPTSDIAVVGPESIIADMQFSTTITVGDHCTQCVAILKQTYHPNWHAYLNGKRVETITVFPFYVGIPVSTPGTHTLVMKYEPSATKMILFTIGFFLAVFLFLASRVKSPLDNPSSHRPN